MALHFTNSRITMQYSFRHQFSSPMLPYIVTFRETKGHGHERQQEVHKSCGSEFRSQNKLDLQQRLNNIDHEINSSEEHACKCLPGLISDYCCYPHHHIEVGVSFNLFLLLTLPNMAIA